MRRASIGVAAALAHALLFAFAPARAVAADAPPAKPAPPAIAATVAGALTEATASESARRTALAHLGEADRWRDLDRRTAALEADVTGLLAGVDAKSGLLELVERERRLRTVHYAATGTVDGLASIVRRVEHDSNALAADAARWRERLAFLDGQHAPGPVLERARSIEASLGLASMRLRDYRDNALPALDRAIALQTRIEAARADVAAQEARVRAQHRDLQQSPFWQLGAVPLQLDLVAVELRAAARLLRAYLLQHAGGLAGLFFGVLALTGWLFTRGRHLDPGSPERGYGRPAAAALLIALMSLWWLAPDPPLLFYDTLLVLVPIPAAVVARRTFGAQVPLSVYGVAFATMLLPLRIAIEASAIGDRVLLLLQALCIAVPIAIDLRRGRLAGAWPRMNPGVVRVAALLVILGAAVTALHVVFGFTGLAGSLRAGMGSVVGFGLVFGAMAVACYGAVLALLATPVARLLRSARDADPALLLAVRVVLAALAIGGVAVVTLGSLGLIPALLFAVDNFLGGTLQIGSVAIGAKAVATALVVALATLVLTALTGFILEREVLPRVQLRPGAGYAIVTFTRWSIVIIGVVLTLAALGMDMANVTLLAGALGVGIGFGLQTIVNNFVSGLILIVERPVGVGDVIERGTLSGKVTRIGIRSSTVRTGQGAEVIVPNSELVSKEVVNWTRSDRQRRYDIDVGVAPGSDPEQVMRVLAAAAGDVPEIMADPPPRAMFKGFGESSLNFTLLAWVQSVDVGLQAQNALRVAILRRLDAAGIDAIPMPPREVRVAAVSDGAAAAKS